MNNKNTNEILNELNKIARDVSNIERYVSDLPDLMEETQNILKIRKDVENFLFELTDCKEVPEWVNEKAGELWSKI